MEQKAVRNEFLCPKKTSFWPKNKESYSTLSACLAAGGNIDESDKYGNTPRSFLLRGEYRLPSADEIDAARRRIAKTRLDLVRHRALEICIGLQPFNLDVLRLCEIMMNSFGALGSLVAFHQWWAIAFKVKHFSIIHYH
jgi:hypothetical protein